MSFSIDTKQETITVNGETFDIEESTDPRDGEITLTIERDGEDAFPGLTARIWYEDEPGFGNPRDWSNVGTMFCDYRGYILGDDDAPDPFDQTVECEACEGTGYADPNGSGWQRDACPKCDGNGEFKRDPMAVLREDYGATVIMPLYVYEHSGITIRAGAPIGPVLTGDDVRSSGRFAMDGAGWDTSTVGFVFDTPDAVRECIGEGATPADIEAALNSEVEVYASYLEGDVTGYTIDDDETGYVDSCGGFVGGHGDHTREEAYASLALAVEARHRENIERANAAARDIITV